MSDKRITYDDFAAISWASFVSFAFRTPGFRDAFVADGGKLAKPATSPIDHMIDAATGHVESEIADFVLWATRKHFGMRYAPRGYRDSVASKRKRICRHRNWNMEADGGARCLGTGCTKTMTKAEVDAATEAS